MSDAEGYDQSVELRSSLNSKDQRSDLDDTNSINSEHIIKYRTYSSKTTHKSLILNDVMRAIE